MAEDKFTQITQGINTELQKFAKEMPEVMAGFSSLSKAATKPGELDKKNKDDLVLSGNGQSVVVDSTSLPFLHNAVIDFSEELIGARFTIENPNATSSCGCGTSFTV